MRNEGEPSVEEILDSIKKVIARDSREITRPGASAAAFGAGSETASSPAAEPSVGLHEDAFNPLAHDRSEAAVPPAVTSMAEAYAAHFSDDADVEIAAPFTEDPYGDEGAVLDLSDIDFIDSAEEALSAHIQGSGYATPPSASGMSAAFASVQNSLKAMGGAVYSPAASRSEPASAPARESAPAPSAYGNDGDALTRESAARSMRESLAALAKAAEPEAPVRAPAAVPAGETSLEGLVRDMLRPMLAQWLDANLPDMVERLVKAEIERILQKRG